MTRVLALPRYSNKGASSRVRTLQYVDELTRRGIEIRVESLLDDAYLERLYAPRSVGYAPRSVGYAGRGVGWLRVMRAYAHRASLRAALGAFDVVWLEKEAFPWLPAAAERWLQSPRTPVVVDYDDAIFHRYDRHASP